MADDTSLLALWTGLAIFLGIYVLWKYRGNYGRQRVGSSQSSHDIKSARLKYFSMNKEVALDGANVDDQTTEDENVLAHDSWEERRGDGKSSDTAATEADVIGFQSSVRYTGTIDSPRTGVFGIETGNSVYDPETGLPITRPLTTLDEVLSWRQGFDCFNVAKVPFFKGCRELEKRPRTLVCHDMKGGYIEDRFVQGYNSCDCFVIYQWQMIDIFVYFSHHFVTIPPPCWSNAAHTHGVPVLGTLITESGDGIKRCQKFLEKKASWETLANQLVDIAEYYRFDGWFINVENHIQPLQVKNLEEFVKYLTKAMHERIEGSPVIWYDSVTYKGDLMWQNELNSSNRIFFDACDGIFLNYLWSEAHLMRSAGAAGRDRIQDVYVGVDVFGRGCFGGGGYNCNKALKVIREENLSAALFAPGWVMETQGSDNFIAHQDKFWNLLAPYCSLHSPVKMIPFVTSMCRGYGKTVMLDGVVVYCKPWTNLSGQQCQPTYNNMFFNLATKSGLTINSIKYTIEEAYNGGGCYVITGQLKPSQETSKGVARLFKTSLHITSPILVSFTFKLHPSDCVEVLLQLRINRLPTYILLCPAPRDNQDGSITIESDFNKTLIHRYGIPHSGKMTSSVFMSPIGEEHYELFAPLTGTYHDFVQQVHARDSEVNETSWCTRHYLIGEKQFIGCTVEEIRVVCASLPGASLTDEFQLHLGEIKIVDPRVLKQPLACVRNIRGLDVVWKNVEQGQLLSLTLMWDCPIPDGEVEEAAHYNVFRATHGGRHTTFLGRAFVEAYRVCQLHVARESVSVEFIVQLVTRSGLKRPLDECSRVQFNWA